MKPIDRLDWLPRRISSAFVSVKGYNENKYIPIPTCKILIPRIIPNIKHFFVMFLLIPQHFSWFIPTAYTPFLKRKEVFLQRLATNKKQ